MHKYLNIQKKILGGKIKMLEWHIAPSVYVSNCLLEKTVQTNQ